ncbi:hypothetical protein C2G38_2152778 [Gigaspora rosea]|uniref:Uncharacterized protein n=1 Tax=Gigaspora rosea TaxID=44941 RepID=A0A397WDB9_9GLOM|nr:hypothetical protein C2G38_2152778 [Gigaspora rosea]
MSYKPARYVDSEFRYAISFFEQLVAMYFDIVFQLAIKSPKITLQTLIYTNNYFTDKLFLPTQNSPTLDLLTSFFSPTS